MIYNLEEDLIIEEKDPFVFKQRKDDDNDEDNPFH